MPAPNILIGGEFFREIRELNCCYIDKTGFLEELLSHVPARVSLITRPRRFGKTLTMTMLQEFFDIQKDSRKLFEGLAVSRNQALCDAWMNRYPTVFLSMKYVEGLNFEEALFSFHALIRRLFSEYRYLLTGPGVDDLEKEQIGALLGPDASKGMLEGSLLALCRALHAHWSRPVILLVDEYDAPLASAQQRGYYEEMVSFVRNLLGAALKTNPSLQFGMLTGCLRIARESIFTGLNNFKCYGISDHKFSDKFGFTADEVDRLLEDAGFSARKAVVREWYDGYRFGPGREIYCPWDILQYVDDLQDEPNALPKTYWSNSSGNAVVRTFIGRTDLNIRDKFEALVNGGCAEARIAEDLTCDSLHSSEDNLWSVLYLTGYLTKASPERISICGIRPAPGKTCLVIPNKAVREIFIESIASWFTDSMLQMDRKPLFDAFWNGDAGDFMKRLSRILLTTISFHDYHEDLYHAVLAGIFVGSGYAVSSNIESGRGRPDILVKDQQNARAAVIEVKHARSAAELPDLVDEALAQIRDREYDASLRGLYEEITLWGMAFFEKRCLVRAER